MRELLFWDSSHTGHRLDCSKRWRMGVITPTVTQAERNDDSVRMHKKGFWTVTFHSQKNQPKTLPMAALPKPETKEPDRPPMLNPWAAMPVAHRLLASLSASVRERIPERVQFYLGFASKCFAERTCEANSVGDVEDQCKDDCGRELLSDAVAGLVTEKMTSSPMGMKVKLNLSKPTKSRPTQATGNCVGVSA